MGPGADDNGESPLLFRPADQAVDALDEGAGGVDNMAAGGLQPLAHILRHAMGADDDGVLRTRFLRAFDNAHTEPPELIHHMAVVDDGSQSQDLVALGGGFLHQFHRPADAEAEAGALCKLHTHNSIFFPTMDLISATTWSISISEVSTLTESRAIFRGAISRWVS